MKKYSINKRNIERWKTDVLESVAFYNNWFLDFAPSTYINARKTSIDKVENTFQNTECLNFLSTELLKARPETISILRMATTPPLARDRLIGLADIPKSLIILMEENKLPQRMPEKDLEDALTRIIDIVNRLFDVDMMPWLIAKSFPNERDRLLATHVIGDRLCGSLADPIIRNEQERRQLNSIYQYLTNLDYRFIESKSIQDFKEMQPGTFSFHLNVPVKIKQSRHVNMPIDVVIMRKTAATGDMPILIECKSAGDFTNTNKRRKEEATKIEQLKNTYGKSIEFILFLCGYFDSGYLGYEAAEGIDWIWEHRITDFQKAGI